MRRKTCGPFHSIQNSTLVFFLYGQNKLGLFYQFTWQKKKVWAMHRAKKSTLIQNVNELESELSEMTQGFNSMRGQVKAMRLYLFRIQCSRGTRLHKASFRITSIVNRFVS